MSDETIHISDDDRDDAEDAADVGPGDQAAKPAPAPTHTPTRKPLSVSEVNALRSLRTWLKVLLDMARPRRSSLGDCDTAKVNRCGKPLLAEVERVLKDDGHALALKDDDERVRELLL